MNKDKGMSIDNVGRVVLSNDDLKNIESAYEPSAGGTTSSNTSNCINTKNDSCHNQLSCTRTTNNTGCRNDNICSGTNRSGCSPDGGGNEVQ